MRIIEFEKKYRDDMIYKVLSAKNAIDRIPRLNDSQIKNSDNPHLPLRRH